MTSLRRALLYGFLIWLIVFLAAFALFPVRGSNRPLFESLMPVVLAIATVFFASRYFRTVRSGFAGEGLRLGLVWLAVNILVDLPLFLAPSPMQMTLAEYAGDIALTYVLMPVITTGIDHIRGHAQDGGSTGRGPG